MLPARRRFLLAERPFSYPLLARFGTALSAPLASPLTVDAGTLTFSDTANTLSASGGALVIGAVGAQATRGGWGTASFARKAGRALLARVAVTTAGSGQRLGWSASASADLSSAVTRWSINVSGGSGFAVGEGTLGQWVTDTDVLATTYDLAIILRATGAWYCIRTVPNGDWTLTWVDNHLTTTPLYAVTAWSSGRGTLDDWRVTDLGAPFDSDYGFCTARIATTANGDTLNAAPNAIIEHTITAATGVTQELSVRRTDDDNRWVVRCDQGAGRVDLFERAAGVETSRAGTTQTFTNGSAYRVVASCDGSTIRIFVNDVLKGTYASATTNQTAQGVKVSHAGADLVAWPRIVPLPRAA